MAPQETSEAFPKVATCSPCRQDPSWPRPRCGSRSLRFGCRFSRREEWPLAFPARRPLQGLGQWNPCSPLWLSQEVCQGSRELTNQPCMNGEWEGGETSLGQSGALLGASTPLHPWSSFSFPGTSEHRSLHLWAWCWAGLLGFAGIPMWLPLEKPNPR